MSKKSSKSKGSAKVYSSQRKGGAAKSFPRSTQASGPSAQQVNTVRIAGIVVMVAAAAAALALALPRAGEFTPGILAALFVLAILTGLGLYAAMRAQEVAQRLAARKR